MQLSNISLTHALSSLLLEYVQILGRPIRVDHVENYRLPKHLADRESGENGNGGDGSNIDKTGPGHAYQGQELASSFDISKGQDLFGGPQVDKSTEKDERLNRNGEEDTCNMSKEERRQAKRARKEARDEKRREKEQRRMRKEEKRRERRARKMKGDSGESASNDDGEYGDSRRARQKEDGEREKKRRKHHRRRSASRSRSRSRSYGRYSSDEESLSSNGRSKKRKRDKRDR